jgi:hypothetical protein
MGSEREKMLAGELYDALDPELVAARNRAWVEQGKVRQRSSRSIRQQVGLIALFRSALIHRLLDITAVAVSMTHPISPAARHADRPLALRAPDGPNGSHRGRESHYSTDRTTPNVVASAWCTLWGAIGSYSVEGRSLILSGDVLRSPRLHAVSWCTIWCATTPS